MYATLPRCAALTASCSSGQHFASGFLQISPRDEHPCLPLTLPLTGCVEDFHLLVVLQPPQLKNSTSHGATRHARRTYKSQGMSPGFFLRSTLKVSKHDLGNIVYITHHDCFLTFKENCFGVIPKNSLKLRIK